MTAVTVCNCCRTCVTFSTGDVFSLRVPGKVIIVLASEKAASDLLDKRSAIYSDRQPFGLYDAYVFTWLR